MAEDVAPKANSTSEIVLLSDDTAFDTTATTDEPESDVRADRAEGPGAAGASEPDRVRLTAWVHGRVQGVGFRWSTRARALELGLIGHAANLADGRVEVVAEGPKPDCDRLLGWLRSGATPGTVRLVVERYDPPRGLTGGFVER
jgi:acylphosphatase